MTKKNSVVNNKSSATDSSKETNIDVIQKHIELLGVLEESTKYVQRLSQQLGSQHAQQMQLLETARINNYKAVLSPVFDLVNQMQSAVHNLSKNKKCEEDVKGLKLSLQSLLQSWQNSCIEVIAPKENDIFDPKQHTVLSVEKSEDSAKNNTIVGVYSLGFKVRSQSQTIVLREAQVRIIKTD